MVSGPKSFYEQLNRGLNVLPYSFPSISTALTFFNLCVKPMSTVVMDTKIITRFSGKRLTITLCVSNPFPCYHVRNVISTLMYNNILFIPIISTDTDTEINLLIPNFELQTYKLEQPFS